VNLFHIGVEADACENVLVNGEEVKGDTDQNIGFLFCLDRIELREKFSNGVVFDDGCQNTDILLKRERKTFHFDEEKGNNQDENGDEERNDGRGDVVETHGLEKGGGVIQLFHELPVDVLESFFETRVVLDFVEII
jgi:hypothetical protein